jgi:hypothetical protein
MDVVNAVAQNIYPVPLPARQARSYKASVGRLR